MSHVATVIIVIQVLGSKLVCKRRIKVLVTGRGVVWLPSNDKIVESKRCNRQVFPKFTRIRLGSIPIQPGIFLTLVCRRVKGNLKSATSPLKSAVRRREDNGLLPLMSKVGDRKCSWFFQFLQPELSAPGELRISVLLDSILSNSSPDPRLVSPPERENDLSKR